MTYCCGILVRDGLVMIADTRTNAGLDNISTFRKLNVIREPGILVDWLDIERVEILHCVPSVFRALINQGLNSNYFEALRYIVLAGEPLLIAAALGSARRARRRGLAATGSPRTSSMTAMAALSPLRGPILVIRV